MAKNITLNGMTGEILSGGGGDDELTATGGYGKVLGRTGNDTLTASAGEFELNGGNGDDHLHVYSGTFTVRGANGDDYIFAEKQDDTPSFATIFGNNGNDTIIAHFGALIRGNNGNDTISAVSDESTPTTVRGGNDDDTISVTGHNAFIFGDNGNDTITASGDGHKLWGKAGSDVFVIAKADPLNGSSSLMVIKDFETEFDQLDLQTHFGITRLDQLEITEHKSSITLAWEADGIDYSLQMARLLADEFSFDDLVGGTDAEPSAPVESLYLSEVTRLRYNDLGDYQVVDFNGDGVMDIVSTNGSFGAGTIWFNGADDSTNRVQYVDPGNFQLADMNGDDVLDVVSDAFGGLGYFDGTSGVFNRLTYNGAGEFIVADLDGDGANEILSKGATYGSGAAVGGTVYFETDGSMHRISYNNLGDFAVGNFDGDAQLEVISNGGSYGSGVAINGFMLFDLDGSMTRYSYYTSSDFIVADVDGDGIDQLISNGAGSLTGGVILNHNNGLQRVTYNDLGDEFYFGDSNGDGKNEIISLNPIYHNGTPITGLMAFDPETGVMTRMSYSVIEDFQLADYDGDGDADVLATGGIFGTGLVQLDGSEII